MAMQTADPIKLLCQTLDVSRAGYYAHGHKPERPRRQQDQTLTPLICQAFEGSRKSYGSPRLQMALRRQEHYCGKNRVARLMRQAGLRARQKRRFRPCTTQSNHGLTIAENWLAKVPDPRAQSGLGQRHHLSADTRRLVVFGNDPGCLQP